MRITDFLTERDCILNLKSQNKEEAILELIEHVSYHPNLKDKEKFIKDVLLRESLGSTGIGKGVAIPHARSSALSGIILGFGRSKEGIEFNSLDGQKVNFIFLIGTDLDSLNTYLRLLAEISSLILDDSLRADLLEAHSEEVIIDIIRKSYVG